MIVKTYFFTFNIVNRKNIKTF